MAFLYSKEFYEVMELFERSVNRGPKDREKDKEWWGHQQYYCNGELNQRFQLFLQGYHAGKAVGRLEAEPLQAQGSEAHSANGSNASDDDRG